MTIDWRAEYEKVVMLEEDESTSLSLSSVQQTTKIQDDKTIAFLDTLLKQEGGEWWMKFCHRVEGATKESDGQKVNAPSEQDKKKLVVFKKRLSDVGSKLMVDLPELNVSVSSKEMPHFTKVRVLQLQLMCRMLCFGTLSSKKREELKKLKKEIRGLLDRVALLLDAANPPSLADEDVDERSPFQKFLQQKLGPRLQMLIPKLMQYLLRVYELEDEHSKVKQDVQGAMNSMLSTPVVKLPQPHPDIPSPSVTGNTSILSALRQERPPKRARPDARELFKEVMLPHQLQQKQMQLHSQKSRRVSISYRSNANKSSRDALHGVACVDSIKAVTTTRALTTRMSGGSELLRRAAAKTSAASSKPMPERSQLAGGQNTIASSPSTATQVGLSAPRRIQSASNAGSAARRTVVTSSVVMRTPDRPKRLGVRSIRRVLVEASPPLRRPSAHLLRSKSSQSGAKPPPLFG
ncbi:unnamed protein product [Peronospora belbahrii]|uniref:Uncharacterized protein n=1 Tax=Peronospora belbahrii TaxID=622444 RepID=A0AAU9KTL6_9STRA|nr:unnamed protein product [Peronospora belbahrii]